LFEPELREGLLHDWLAEAAALYPDRPAVVEPGRTVTHAELHERSLSIASALRRHGLETGDRVALVMEKSADAVAAMYGTLIAGGVYVPVQPSWPGARVEAVLADCDARFVVRDSESPASAAPTVRVRQTGATLEWPELIAWPPLAEPVKCSPEEPAFILFTSGSTGTPKGVTISHRAVGAFVDWAVRQFRVGPDDRIACPSPLSFDLSTFDVFSIARAGSACVIVPPAAAWVPRLLLSMVRDERVTVWYSVPSMLVHLMDRAGLDARPVASLRTILFAGEVMPPREAARLRSSHRTAELYNLYGPTETNVVTWHRLPEEIDPERPVSIGRPCPYARLRFDDSAGRLSGLSSSSELLVAGASLMSGYWNRPEETARAFTEYEDEAGRSRYYRTGDRVSIEPAGDITFVGRGDRQLKRKGYRIELGEIEAAMASHPGVGDVAVVAAEGSHPRLTAFACGRGAPPPDQGALRSHCALILPAYMIPDRFLILDTMPRGSRGKIDYATLQRLDRSTPWPKTSEPPSAST
jgi:amino acid adenylation domain-containing protein